MSLVSSHTISLLLFLSSGTALCCRLRGCGRAVFTFSLRITALGAGVLCALRYWQAWPMMPLHTGIISLLFLLSLFLLLPGKYRGKDETLPVLLLCACANLFCPKDFYLPFILSLSPWAFAFLLMGALAHSMLISATACALNRMRCGESDLSPVMNRVVAGYALLTISMFCGEVWSYLGWGSPVVWQDATAFSVIALWFYWSGLLHLHHLGRISLRWRRVALLLGGVLTLLCVVLPDLGPLRMPESLRWLQ